MVLLPIEAATAAPYEEHVLCFVGERLHLESVSPAKVHLQVIRYRRATIAFASSQIVF